MLRNFKLLVMAAVASAWLAGPAAAQDAIGKAFSEALFTEVQINRSVREHPDVSGLTKDEMNAVLQARDALTGFFTALKGGGGQVRGFLSPTLSAQYADALALRRDRFGAQTYLSYEIFDFRVTERMDRVKFRYFLAENDHGKALIRQRAVTFDRMGGSWKIAEFDNFDFD